MKTRAPLLIILGGMHCFAQAPAFEVVVIKPSSTVAGQSGMMTGVRIDQSQATISSLSLETVIAMAFRVQPYLVVGPDWLKTTAFNITAKLPAGASANQVPEMLQTLFADRFKLVAHRENREQPVYVLTTAKSGLKLKEQPPGAGNDGIATPEPAASTVVTPLGEMQMSRDAKGMGLSGAGIKISITQDGVRFEVSQFARLAEMLSADAGRPVLDETNLKGNYPIVFGISSSRPVMPREAGAAPDPVDDNPTFTALRQLGIIVESRKAPVETIVIDHMEKTPTEN